MQKKNDIDHEIYAQLGSILGNKIFQLKTMNSQTDNV